MTICVEILKENLDWNKILWGKNILINLYSFSLSTIEVIVSLFFFNVFFMRWMKHLAYRTSLHLYHSLILVWSLLWKLNPFLFSHQNSKNIVCLILLSSFFWKLPPPFAFPIKIQKLDFPQHNHKNKKKKEKWNWIFVPII